MPDALGKPAARCVVCAADAKTLKCVRCKTPYCSVACQKLDSVHVRENGDGVARDVAEAARWYERAAAKGDEDAKYNLARLRNAR